MYAGTAAQFKFEIYVHFSNMDIVHQYIR